MKILKNSPKKFSPSGAPRTNSPRGFRSIRPPYKKKSYFKRLFKKWRNQDTGRMLGGAKLPIDSHRELLVAESDQRYHAVAIESEAEARVREQQYSIAKKKFEGQAKIIGTEVEKLDEWHEQENSRLHYELDRKKEIVERSGEFWTKRKAATESKIRELANQLQIPHQSAKVQLSKPWVLPALLVIALADWQGIAASMGVTGLDKRTAELIALGLAFIMTFLAHTCGHLIRKKGNKATLVAIGLSIFPFIAIAGLSILRTRFMEMTTSIPVDHLSYNLTFIAMLGAGYIAGMVIGYVGKHPQPESVRAFNQALGERNRIQKRLERLEAEKATIDTDFSNALDALQADYTAKWERVVHELPPKIFEELESATRDYFHIEVTMDQLRKQVDAELAVELAQTKTRFLLAGGAIKKENTLKVRDNNRRSIRSPKIGNGLASVIAAIFLLILFLPGCSVIEDKGLAQESHVVILHDRSGSTMGKGQLYTDKDLLRIGEIDTVAPAVFHGLKLEGTIITGTFSNESILEHLPAGNSQDNLWIRKSQVREWIAGFDFADRLHTAPTKAADGSNVIDPLAAGLQTLANSSSDRKLMIVASDAIHHAGNLSMQNQATFDQMQTDPDGIEERVEEIAQFPESLRGIKVVFLYKVEHTAESEAQKQIFQFWVRMLAKRGAEVETRTNLPHIW